MHACVCIAYPFFLLLLWKDEKAISFVDGVAVLVVAFSWHWHCLEILSKFVSYIRCCLAFHHDLNWIEYLNSCWCDRKDSPVVRRRWWILFGLHLANCFALQAYRIQLGGAAIVLLSPAWLSLLRIRHSTFTFSSWLPSWRCTVVYTSALSYVLGVDIYFSSWRLWLRWRRGRLRTVQSEEERLQQFWCTESKGW